MPLRISQRKPTDVEPAVDAISATMAALNVVRLARFVCFQLRGDCVLKIVRMNDVGGIPAFQLFKSLAEVFDGWLVDALDFTGWCGHRNWRRNAVHDQTKSKFAGAQGFLGAVKSRDEIVFPCSLILPRFHERRMLQLSAKCLP